MNIADIKTSTPKLLKIPEPITPKQTLQTEQGQQQRRSSSRSIKRRRFDDEIVQYSIGIASTHMGRHGGRSRTTSQTYVPQTVKMPTPPLSTSSTSTQKVEFIQPAIPIVQPMHFPEKRKAQKAGRKPKKPAKPFNQIAIKDLGRWKPFDDLSLIIGVQQSNDLRAVHRGTKFSCKFTLQEIQSRWYSLLYDESISRLAIAAIRNLHPELVATIRNKALYTQTEEAILGSIKSSDSPVLETFKYLLDKSPHIFYQGRTAKTLQAHWCLMKQHSLLSDQNIKSTKETKPFSFSDAEESMIDSELNECADDELREELTMVDRRNKREIRNLENELGRWNVIVDSLTKIGITPEFDNQTLGILRGRLVRYLMRSKEITFGRSTKDTTVDIDLALEGPAYKVSRKQGMIKLRSNGDFFISNDGKRSIFINATPLLPGNKARLSNNSVLEITGLRFIFLVNYDLINAIRHESAKTTSPIK